MWIFGKWKIIVFGQNHNIFLTKGGLKRCIIMYLGNIQIMFLVPVTFGNFFFSNPPKKALFGLNWEESKWPGHFCSIVLYFFASKIGVKLPPKKKFLDTAATPRSAGGQKTIFVKKMHFSGRKLHFFRKFISAKMFSDPKYNFSNTKIQMENYSFWPKLWHFLAQRWSKTMYNNVFG